MVLRKSKPHKIKDCTTTTLLKNRPFSGCRKCSYVDQIVIAIKYAWKERRNS